VNPTFGCEQGAPDPHSELWMGAMATILREARLQKLGDLLDAAIGYFADHVAMVRPFFTPAGIRIPCARAKAPGNLPLRPNWTVDSLAYATLLGLPASGLGKADKRTIKILQDSSSLFPQIVARSKTTTLKLAVPIRQWRHQNGSFSAAFVEDVPMNDRCSWLVVDAAGTIQNAANTLSSFTIPAEKPAVFGGAAAPDHKPDPVIVDPKVDFQALANQVRALLLPKKQAKIKETAADDIANGKLADALPLVQSFGIGDAQEQAVVWKSIIATLQGAVHA
jgi:hypothetical protein